MATLRICGNASAAPPAGGACSAYLVETASTRLLLDIGPGSLARVREATDVHDLDGIIISHMHTDHFLDLLVLNVARFTSPGARMHGGARWRLPVWVPPGARATVEACFRALQVNVSGTTASRWEENFDVREYDPDETIAVNELAVSFVGPTKHAQLDFGMRIDVGGRVLAYTGDTAFCQAAIEIGRGADIFLAECTLMDPGPASETHTASHELVQMAAEARPAQLLATHFVDHSHGWREELRGRLSRDLSMPSHVVQVGDRFEF